MQIISRRVNEGIIIGEETQITVLDIGDETVQLEIRSSDDEFREVVTLSLSTLDDGWEAVGDKGDALLAGLTT